MATRLTNDIRDSIVAKLMKHRFADAAQALVADRAAFAEKVYCDIYSKAQREKMEALPKGWLSEKDAIGVALEESRRSYVTLRFDGRIYGDLNTVLSPAREARLKRVIDKHRGTCAKSYPADHKLAVEHGQLSDRADGLLEEFRLAKNKASAALASVTTIKRLIETWPEIEPFAKEFDKTPPKLPAIPTSDLNQLLDLPVAEAA